MYWKSVHGNGKYAIWNCRLKWIIGKAEDMPNCLSWAESDYESKVTQELIKFDINLKNLLIDHE